MIYHQRNQYLAAISLITLVVVSAAAQTTTQYDRATPPQDAAGVSSFGSYVSTELGTVNLANGSLNFKIPIGSVGGRGFSIPLTLNYSSKVWSASMDTDVNGAGAEMPVAYADYDRGGDWIGWGHFIGAGWSIGGVPSFHARRVRIQRITDGQCSGGYAYLLTKLTLKMPDGGEVEFRDDLYEGAPLPASACGGSAASRGVRWHATDGSGMIFIKDAAQPDGVLAYDTSGVVITRDGTRYRFDGSVCTSITDRNGNKMTIEYPPGLEVRYTDQLGRVTSIKQNVADPDNPSITLAVLVTIPGYQGQSRYFKIKSGVMNQNYRSGIAPTLPVINGDWDPQSRGYAWPAGTTRLFAKSYGRYAYQIDDLNVLTEVILPDSRSLSFRYNKFGEVAEATLPTGGKIQYDYSYVSSLPSGNSRVWQTGTGGVGGGILTDVKPVDRAVSASRTYPDGTTLEGSWSYSFDPQSTQVQVRSSSDTLLLDQRHFFLGADQYTEAPNGMDNHDGTFYSLWSTGVEWRTETRDDIGNILAATEQDWTQRAPVSWSGYTQEQPANDNRVNHSRRYLENGMMAKTETDYDQYNNPIEVREYDFDQSLKRKTTTTYLTSNNGFNYATDDAIHLMSLPVTTTIFNGGTQVAQSVNEYDVYTNDTNHAPLTDYGSVSQHDSNYGIAKTTRGNVTRVGQWLNTTGTFIYSYPRFDTLGNVISTKDPKGNVTTISFADDFGNGSNPGTPTQNPATPTYALPTLITSPPPSAGAPVHTARSQYDYSTGLLTGFRDRNNIVTQTFYNDPFDRPTQVKSALGVSGVETHSTTYYAPTTVFGITLAKNDVLIATDLNTLDDASIRSWTVTDGFGRTKEAWKRDPQGDVKVVTVYDALGRVKQTSNPFRPATETDVYTTTAYDLAGRISSVTTPDSSVVTTSYVGNTVTVTDQAGKARKSVTDALGRLTDVYEDPNGLNYQTTYSYDVLDNLTTVTQGTQTRTFVYDSLKRLRSATNPESGTISYDYDNNSNLTQKTDARGIVSVYEYDALNRNITINYSDTSINPDVTRSYDGASNGKGRLWSSYAGGSESVGTNVEKTLIDSYDALGRPKVLQQSFKLNGVWSSVYQVSRNYNLAGDVTTQTYPSGHTVTYNYDSAGRLADKDASNLAFTGTLGDGVQRTYSRGISYVSSGALQQEQFGTTTPVYNKLSYNSRLQLSEILTSTTGGDNSWNRGKIINSYSLQCSGADCNATDNNGNLRKQQVYIPADDQVSSSTSWYQQYDYDNLNRLQRVQEYTPSLNWQQEYVYDRWGNRTIHQTNTWGTGINKKDFTVNTTTNRLGVPAGQSGTMTYDAAGNLTTDSYSGYGAATFDADNHMLAAQDSFGGWSYYTYNADGQRTRRKINNQETWQVYGIDGELLAEYPANGAVGSPQKEYGYRNGQLLITAASAQGAPSSGLAGYWKFDENSGTTAADSSGTGNTGTLTSGAAWASGQNGSAVSVDGVDDYVQVGAQSSLVMTSAASFSAWIYPTGAGSNATLGGTILVKEGEYVIARFPDGTIQWGFANSNPGWLFVNTGYVAPLNQWTHVAVTYDNGTIKTYANGTLVHTYSGSGSIGDAITGQNDFRIGGRQVISQYFQGRIDEVQVYNRALSATEVSALAGISAGLRGYWKFDENSGTTAADSSGTGNSGTLTSGAAWASGQNGSAVSADGVDDYVQVGAQSSLVMTSAASFSAWIYPTGAGSNATLGGTILVKEGEYVIARFPDGTIQWGFANSNPGWLFINTGYVAPLNQWTHVAVTYDNGTIKTYANGSLVHTYGGSGSIGDAITGQNDFRIGGRQVISQYFQGRIDEVRVYNRALSASEVTTLSNGTSTSGVDLKWLVTDQLGTPRIILDQTGSLVNVKRHDYLPFGEELFASTGLRTTALGYSGGDGVRQQFTLKERDNETGLDYFLARYYSSTQGRFTSPDPLDASGHAIAPQSWNRYSYVLNNPLKLTDPDGEMWAYHYLDEAHKRIGIAWIDGNKIPKDLKAKGYQALDFGGAKSKDVSLTDGSVVRLGASSGRPEVLRGAQGSGEGGYVNAGLVRELGRQTAPLPKATGLFIVASVAGGYNIAVVGGPVVLADAAAFALATARNMGNDGDAQVMGTTSNAYQEITKGGSIRNVQTDISKAEFIQNLQDAGYKMTKSGTVTILDNGVNRYVVYDVARSTGGPSAAFSRAGEGQSLKIRLK